MQDPQLNFSHEEEEEEEQEDTEYQPHNPQSLQKNYEKESDQGKLDETLESEGGRSGRLEGLANAFDSSRPNLISKLSSLLLTQTFLPKGKNLHQTLVYLDLSIKAELILNDLSNALVVISIFEIGLFVLGFALFCSDSVEMTAFWIHILHLPRGVIGYLLSKKIPKSYQLADTLSVNSDQKMTFEMIKETLVRGVKTAFETFGKSCKTYLLCYFILTTCLMLMDFIGIFI